jgi:hypothetical protein
MKKSFAIIALLVLVLSILLSACATGYVPTPEPDPLSAQKDAARKASTEARASTGGESIEIRNIQERITRTNLPGHVGFIYFVSPYDGTVILKATFVGKPTSTSKRLDPSETYEWAKSVDCGESYCDEALQYENVGADGSYGSSTPGIFWFTTDGQMMEERGEAAVVLVLERPYLFKDNKVDMTVDVRLQADQVDGVLEAQAIAVEKYINETPGWKVGDPIPLEVLKSAGGN